MKRARIRHRIDPRIWASLPLLLLLAATTACNGGSSSPTSPPSGPFRLTFSLDAAFQGPHGGQPIAIAIVRTSDGSVVAQANGAVSVSQNPSFAWSTGPLLQIGIDYEVHYWIDSNFDGVPSGVAIPKPSTTSGAWSSCRCPMTSTGWHRITKHSPRTSAVHSAKLSRLGKGFAKLLYRRVPPSDVPVRILRGAARRPW